MLASGKLTLYSLQNTAAAGLRPVEQLVAVSTAFYSNQKIGVTRAYAAMAANQRIDMVVRCHKITVPVNAEYVILEDGQQYRIALKQESRGYIDLTLVRLSDFYDVEGEDEND